LFDVKNSLETTDDLTSPTLILSLQNGDDDGAWQRVVRIYGPLIFSWCKRCGLQESDAADVSQDVLADLSKSIGGFSRDGDGSTFRGWLWRITRNKIADHFRRWAKTPSGSGGTGALQMIEQLPDENPETSEDVTDLHLRALEGLRCNFNESTWTAFWRVVVEGDSAKDVAEDIGISVWAVYKAKTRVMAKLRAELGG
jgi:RNA polymerase sigma-70 factor (ECF subfamily)